MRTKKLLHRLLKLAELLWDKLSDSDLFQFLVFAVVITVVASVSYCCMYGVFSLFSRIFGF